MPAISVVPVDLAVNTLIKYITYFNTDKLPEHSSRVWQDISDDLKGLWKVPAVRINVRQDRRKILTLAREKCGIIIRNKENIEGNILVEHNYFNKNDVNNILEPTHFKDTEETVVPEPEKYSWQKNNEVVSITDPIDTEEFADENSLYNDDRAPTPILEVDVDDSPLHVGFQCNACKGEIKGFRYTCVQCEDFDLCSACELNGAHAQHYMLRVPKPKPYMETQIVLERIRRHLMKKLDPIEGDQEPEDDTSLKLDIKSEVDEEEELAKDMEIEDIGDTTTSDQDESIILRAVENTPDTSIRKPEERNVNDSTSRQMDTVPSTAKRKIIVPHTDIQLQDGPPAKINLVPVKRIEFRQNVTRKEVYLENSVLLKPQWRIYQEAKEAIAWGPA